MQTATEATDVTERRTSWRARLLVAAPFAIGLAVAALAALPAVEATDPPGLAGWPCGSVASPNGAPTLQRVTAEGEPDGVLDFCGDALASRRRIAGGALLAGIAGSAAVWVALRRQPTANRARPQSRHQGVTS